MKRSLPIDFLRISLALMVLFLHCGLPFITTDEVSYLFRNGIFRIAVPVFFVINGYYILEALSSRKSMVVWSKRLLCMYAFWMMLYLPFYFPAQVSFKNAASFISVLIFGYFHLWYISALLMAGWILFFLHNKPTRFLAFAVVLAYVAGVCIQYYAAYFGIRMPIWISRGPLLFAFPMLTIGYLFRKIDLVRYQSSAVIILIIGIFLLLAESWFAYVALSRPALDMFLALIVVCPMVFIVALNMPGFGNSDHPAKLSSAIYFCHPLFLWISREFFHTGWGTNTSIITLVFCLLIYYPLYILSKRFKFIF